MQFFKIVYLIENFSFPRNFHAYFKKKVKLKNQFNNWSIKINIKLR